MPPMFHPTTSQIVRDPRVLDFNFVPDRLPHREEQMKLVSALFSPILTSPVSQTAFFHGSVGTGKTSLAKRFCEDFRKAAEGKKAVDFAVVNCRDRRSPQKVVFTLARKFQPSLVERGFSVPEMLDIFRKDLEKRRTHFIVVLDEVDVLLAYEGGGDLVYQLTRFDEEEGGMVGRLSLILISTKNVMDNLDLATRSTFKGSTLVRFGKYNREQLVDIIKQRVDLGLFPGTVPVDVIDMMADIGAASGDARKVIELLQAAAGYADIEARKRIHAEDVRAAKAQVEKVGIEPLLMDLPLHKKMTLLGVARALKDSASTTTGEAEKNYHVICEELQEEKRGHTQFWKYLKELSGLGILETKGSSKGVHGTTTIISLHELPASVLIEALEKELFSKM